MLSGKQGGNAEEYVELSSLVAIPEAEAFLYHRKP